MSGTVQAEGLRKELAKVAKETADLQRLTDGMVPRLGRLGQEATRLRKALARTAEEVQEEKKMGTLEHEQFVKTKEQLRKLRHDSQERVHDLSTKLADASKRQRAVSLELNGLQRNRLDEARRTKA